MSKHISSIVAVFNGERYLREALDSILKQTLPSQEIIVVDDGSTDGTRSVVESHGDQIRYVWQENAGPGAARNRGVELATGDFNEDGRADLAGVSRDGVTFVLLGAGDGTFQRDEGLRVGLNPHAIEYGDFDGDDLEDLAVANEKSNGVSVLLGRGDGP